MAAKVVELADAVVVALNATTFTLPFTAVRTYVPTLGKQDEAQDGLAALTVVVIPSEQSFAPLARGGDDHDYVIDIGIFQRVTPTDIATVDQLVDPLLVLAEEIADLFRGNQVMAELPARFQSATNTPVYDQEMLRQNRLFGTVWRLTFRTSRDKS